MLGSWEFGFILLIVLAAILAIALFISPLMIWHHTGRTCDKLDLILGVMKQIRDHETGSAAVIEKSVPDPLACPKCGTDLGAINLAPGETVRCPSCSSDIVAS